MDNNASRINSLNTNRMNSQTAGGQTRTRTAASGTNSAGAQIPEIFQGLRAATVITVLQEVPHS